MHHQLKSTGRKIQQKTKLQLLKIWAHFDL